MSGWIAACAAGLVGLGFVAWARRPDARGGFALTAALGWAAGLGVVAWTLATPVGSLSFFLGLLVGAALEAGAIFALALWRALYELDVPREDALEPA